jgi:hypothetical protein
MEILLELYQSFETVYNGLLGILGFDPFLILTVFLIVATAKGLIGKFMPVEYRKQLLTAMCFIASFALIYVTAHEPSTWIKSSIILGSITSFTYNLFKFVLQWAVDRLVQKLEQSTGKDYDDPELPF